MWSTLQGWGSMSFRALRMDGSSWGGSVPNDKAEKITQPWLHIALIISLFIPFSAPFVNTPLHHNVHAWGKKKQISVCVGLHAEMTHLSPLVVLIWRQCGNLLGNYIRDMTYTPRTFINYRRQRQNPFFCRKTREKNKSQRVVFAQRATESFFLYYKNCPLYIYLLSTVQRSVAAVTCPSECVCSCVCVCWRKT